tara:strand:- start:563 stop:1402 length:840 start_codon:yes stop_codon:yes gene_type:complete
MKYFSAVVSDRETQATTLYPPYQILCSYHYWKTSKLRKLIPEYIKKGFTVFVDSGAFSAANSGAEIDIDDYCKFIIETGATYYASLDVFGNSEQTMKNHWYMVNTYNLKPIPTFHMGSPLSDLGPVIESNDYIALGGLVSSSGIMDHCDEVWQYILANKPNLKVHGFGLTNIELMDRYPWYSVDSSSFKSCKRFGRQNILWNGYNFKTFSEKEYLILLEGEGMVFPVSEDKKEQTILNKKRWFIYDLRSAQSYKLYAQHLGALNKKRGFPHLTAQTKLF